MNSQNEALNMLVQNIGHLAIYLSFKKGSIFTLPHLRIEDDPKGDNFRQLLTAYFLDPQQQ
jgi:hypothetical protein